MSYCIEILDDSEDDDDFETTSHSTYFIKTHSSQLSGTNSVKKKSKLPKKQPLLVKPICYNIKEYVLTRTCQHVNSEKVDKMAHGSREHNSSGPASDHVEELFSRNDLRSPIVKGLLEQGFSLVDVKTALSQYRQRHPGNDKIIDTELLDLVVNLSKNKEKGQNLSNGKEKKTQVQKRGPGNLMKKIQRKGNDLFLGNIKVKLPQKVGDKIVEKAAPTSSTKAKDLTISENEIPDNDNVSDQTYGGKFGKKYSKGTTHNKKNLTHSAERDVRQSSSESTMSPSDIIEVEERSTHKKRKDSPSKSKRLKKSSNSFKFDSADNDTDSWINTRGKKSSTSKTSVENAKENKHIQDLKLQESPEQRSNLISSGSDMEVDELRKDGFQSEKDSDSSSSTRNVFSQIASSKYRHDRGKENVVSKSTSDGRKKQRHSEENAQKLKLSHEAMKNARELIKKVKVKISPVKGVNPWQSVNVRKNSYIREKIEREAGDVISDRNEQSDNDSSSGNEFEAESPVVKMKKRKRRKPVISSSSEDDTDKDESIQKRSPIKRMKKLSHNKDQDSDNQSSEDHQMGIEDDSTACSSDGGDSVLLDKDDYRNPSSVSTVCDESDTDDSTSILTEPVVKNHKKESISGNKSVDNNKKVVDETPPPSDEDDLPGLPFPRKYSPKSRTITPEMPKLTRGESAYNEATPDMPTLTRGESAYSEATENYSFSNENTINDSHKKNSKNKSAIDSNTQVTENVVGNKGNDKQSNVVNSPISSSSLNMNPRVLLHRTLNYPNDSSVKQSPNTYSLKSYRPASMTGQRKTDSGSSSDTEHSDSILSPLKNSKSRLMNDNPKPSTNTGQISDKSKPSTNTGQIDDIPISGKTTGKISDKSKPSTSSGQIGDKPLTGKTTGKISDKSKPSTSAGQVSDKLTPSTSTSHVGDKPTQSTNTGLVNDKQIENDIGMDVVPKKQSAKKCLSYSNAENTLNNAADKSGYSENEDDVINIDDYDEGGDDKSAQSQNFGYTQEDDCIWVDDDSDTENSGGNLSQLIIQIDDDNEDSDDEDDEICLIDDDSGNELDRFFDNHETEDEDEFKEGQVKPIKSERDDPEYVELFGDEGEDGEFDEIMDGEKKKEVKKEKNDEEEDHDDKEFEELMNEYADSGDDLFDEPTQMDNGGDDVYHAATQVTTSNKNQVTEISVESLYDGPTQIERDDRIDDQYSVGTGAHLYDQPTQIEIENDDQHGVSEEAQSAGNNLISTESTTNGKGNDVREEMPLDKINNRKTCVDVVSKTDERNERRNDLYLAETQVDFLTDNNQNVTSNSSKSEKKDNRNIFQSIYDQQTQANQSAGDDEFSDNEYYSAETQVYAHHHLDTRGDNSSEIRPSEKQDQKSNYEDLDPYSVATQVDFVEPGDIYNNAIQLDTSDSSICIIESDSSPVKRNNKVSVTKSSISRVGDSSDSDDAYYALTQVDKDNTAQNNRTDSDSDDAYCALTQVDKDYSTRQKRDDSDSDDAYYALTQVDKDYSIRQNNDDSGSDAAYYALTQVDKDNSTQKKTEDSDSDAAYYALTQVDKDNSAQNHRSDSDSDDAFSALTQLDIGRSVQHIEDPYGQATQIDINENVNIAGSRGDDFFSVENSRKSPRPNLRDDLLLSSDDSDDSDDADAVSFSIDVDKSSLINRGVEDIEDPYAQSTQLDVENNIFSRIQSQKSQSDISKPVQKMNTDSEKQGTNKSFVRVPSDVTRKTITIPAQHMKTNKEKRESFRMEKDMFYSKKVQLPSKSYGKKDSTKIQESHGSKTNDISKNKRRHSSGSSSAYKSKRPKTDDEPISMTQQVNKAREEMERRRYGMACDPNTTAKQRKQQERQAVDYSDVPIPNEEEIIKKGLPVLSSTVSRRRHRPNDSYDTYDRSDSTSHGADSQVDSGKSNDQEDVTDKDKHVSNDKQDKKNDKETRRDGRDSSKESEIKNYKKNEKGSKDNYRIDKDHKDNRGEHEKNEKREKDVNDRGQASDRQDKRDKGRNEKASKDKRASERKGDISSKQSESSEKEDSSYRHKSSDRKGDNKKPEISEHRQSRDGHKTSNKADQIKSAKPGTSSSSSNKVSDKLSSPQDSVKTDQKRETTPDGHNGKDRHKNEQDKQLSPDKTTTRPGSSNADSSRSNKSTTKSILKTPSENIKQRSKGVTFVLPEMSNGPSLNGENLVSSKANDPKLKTISVDTYRNRQATENIAKRNVQTQKPNEAARETTPTLSARPNNAPSVSNNEKLQQKFGMGRPNLMEKVGQSSHHSGKENYPQLQPFVHPHNQGSSVVRQQPQLPQSHTGSHDNYYEELQRCFGTEYIDYFLYRLLKWNPLWLEEAEKPVNAGIVPPPIELEGGKLNYIPQSFNSFADYYKIFIPHVLHEVWEMCLRDWKELRARGKKLEQKFYLNIGDKSPFCPELICYKLYGIIGEDKLNVGLVLKETCLVMISFTFFKDGKKRHVKEFGLIEKVETKKHPQMIQNLRNSSSVLDAEAKKIRKELVLVQYTVKLRNRKYFRILDGDVVIEPLTEKLVTVTRQVMAMMQLPRSPLCNHILQPARNSVFCEKATLTQRDHNELTNYNLSQRQAICTASLIAKLEHIQKRICLLQGPPGTGKSHTIIGIIKKIMRDSNFKSRIILCAPSNGAIDELVRRLERAKQQQERSGSRFPMNVVRVGSSVSHDVADSSLEALMKKRKMEANMLPSTREEMQRLKTMSETIRSSISKKFEEGQDPSKMQTDLRKIERKLRDMQQENSRAQNVTITPEQEWNMECDILQKANVICGTLSSMGRVRLQSILMGRTGSIKQETKMFNCVIIDEATQATELDCLIPLTYNCSKLIMVGDPEQLPPTVLSKEAGDKEFGLSLFERIFNYFNLTDNSPVLMLDTQYRMDPEITYFPSHYVYEGRLQTDVSVLQRCDNFPLKPYILFNLVEGQEQAASAGSISNPTEADFTVELCKYMLSEKIKQHVIGIIAPYQEQKSLLQKALANGNMSQIEVNTVDGFQGREKDVIILSCVRARSTSGGIGFLNNRKRMNVALTRAKYALYVVGHLESLKAGDDWKKLIENATGRDAIYQVQSNNDFKTAVRHCHKHRSRNTR